MSDTIQIDQAGRLVLPKPLRDRFHLQAGDSLTVQVKGESIELRPAKPRQRLKRVNGILIVTGGTPVSPGKDLITDLREERIQNLIAEGKRK